MSTAKSICSIHMYILGEYYEFEKRNIHKHTDTYTQIYYIDKQIYPWHGKRSHISIQDPFTLPANGFLFITHNPQAVNICMVSKQLYVK